MQLTIAGVPAGTVSKVLKNLSVSVHYLNEYLKKSWGVEPVLLESPMTFDSLDATSDACSEFQPSHDDHRDNMGLRNDTDEQESTVINFPCDKEDRGGANQEVRAAPDCKSSYLTIQICTLM